ncbi:NAD(+)/NADH kinase [Candidatus Woesearchaeota archaeon]|nr:NAD(+)/NADH kinase [Candidatus Woesearchaeota archaeon]
MKFTKALIVFHNDKNIESNLSFIKGHLTKKGLKVLTIDRDKLCSSLFQELGLVVVIGGDGTFLRTSHFNKSIPMLGFNSNVKEKEGFLMVTNKSNFQRLFLRLMRGEYQVSKLARLQCTRDNRKLGVLALNDIFIGSKKPYKMFNYDVTMKGISEYQRGSGVLVCTPTGSSAWMKSAGGRVMDMEEERFQFLARELYEARIKRDYRLVNCILETHEKVLIKSKNNDAVIVFDSIGADYRLKKGATAEIALSDTPLHFINFK